ncbi:MAG: lipoprotein [Candidatus Omnitrophica bacterium]|nr:lipoprotein [Candidatus Omnitrophota bacterium]MBU2045063.1 lipoprotein [Candidatus Omnitrophota bacterium]MBU2251100.1 lipoprotein [Candidatus Omnitrophota bacterium]MBU2266345.1 lipoprotein [Candidatus Omnitrophota bacterium]MBU2473200.1 lipoprotein [Candidatus Omnitrophota bacterium]
MQKLVFFTFLILLLAGCQTSHIRDDHRLKGLTKGQRVNNNFLHAKRGKILKEIFIKAAKPYW